MVRLALTFTAFLCFTGSVHSVGAEKEATDDIKSEIPVSIPMVEGASLKELSTVSWLSNQIPPHEAFHIEESIPLKFELNNVLSTEGAFAFWFKLPKEIKTGHQQRRERFPLLTLEGLVEVVVDANSDHIQFFIQFTEDLDGSVQINRDYEVRAVLPELGDEWMHLFVHWNASTGERNAFLNGTPFFIERPLPAWNPGKSELAIVGSRGLSLADIRIDPSLRLTDFEDDLVKAGVKGSSDNILGAASLGKLDADSLKGQLLYEQSFTREPDDGWVMEGPGIVEFSEEGMLMKSAYPDEDTGHIVYWCPDIFPDSFVAEWEFELLSEYGLSIIFFAASGTEGRDLFDPSLPERTGIFRAYTKGEVEAYHISYYADAPLMPRPTSNLRKNPGLILMANGPVGVPPFSPKRHKVVLVKDGGHIRLAVDGAISIDFVDDGGERFGDIHREGRIGFRHMRWTESLFKNFRVYELK